MDFILSVFLRGLIIFLAGAALPLITKVWVDLVDKSRISPYIHFWGVSIGIFALYFVVKDSVAPLLAEVFGVVS